MRYDRFMLVDDSRRVEPKKFKGQRQGQDSRNPIDDTMMMPVRCFSCGAVVADKWEEYDKRVNKDTRTRTRCSTS